MEEEKVVAKSPGGSPPSSSPGPSTSPSETHLPAQHEASGEAAASPPPSPRDVHGMAWVLVVVTTISSMFLFGLDQTITADVQPAIVAQFQDINKLPWVSVTLLLGASASNLFWGQVYANYNAKWIFLVCFLIFEVGSALCGAAPTIDVLIVGRALCGFGGTGMYNGVMTILSTSTTDKERALYMSIPGLAWGSSTVLGPVVGGAFTDSAAGWRWGFYINLCIGAACLPVYIFLVPSKDPRPALAWTARERFRRIDLIGFVLLVGIFVGLLMGINFGGLIYAWGSGSIIACFVVAGVLAVVFFAQQGWAWGIAAEDRSFPLSFLRDPVMVVNFLSQTASATATFIPIYFIPLYFQFVRGDSALSAAVRLLPYIAFLVATVIVEGFIMSHWHNGRFLPWFWLGGCLVVVGGALLYTVDAGTSTARIYGASIVLGTGTGAYLQLPFAVAQAHVPPDRIAIAIGWTAFAQLAAPALSLSAAQSVFLNKATQSVRALVPGISPEALQRVIANAGRSELDALTPATRAAIIDAIIAALSRVYIFVLAGGGLTVVLTAFLTVRGYGRSSTTKEAEAEAEKQAPDTA